MTTPRSPTGLLTRRHPLVMAAAALVVGGFATLLAMWGLTPGPAAPTSVFELGKKSGTYIRSNG